MRFARPSRRRLVLALTLAVLACGPARAAIDPAAATAVFREAQAICDRDRGALWGRPLCGAMLLVDPEDRTVIANQADAKGALKASGGLFVGTLPDSEIVANTRVEWSGTLWSELIWPLPADEAKRHVMLAHEMFHRIQEGLGLSRPEPANAHLDTLEGRYLLQLEWRALAAALKAPNPAARKAAVADALLFRAERYRLFPQAAADEAALEINEGVPEYTGVRLGLATPRERVDYALRDLTAFLQAPTFVRSFAYATDPAYGLLLDEADPAWRGKVASGARLDQLLGAALKAPASDPAALKARAAVYDDGALRAAEVKRDQDKTAHLAALKARLSDGPVLVLPLGKFSYQFNPQTLQPLGDLGTVFPTMRLSDDWGVLEVESGGALIDKAKTRATVSVVGADASHLKGDGWKLTLNPGWSVGRGSRPGDFAVSRAAGSQP